MNKNLKYLNTLKFSNEFIFGSAVAAFQIEGNSSGERKSDWDNFFDKNHDQIVRPGEIGPNWWEDSEGVKNDLENMSKLGLKMQRLNLEWARIEPQKGNFDQKAMDKYKHIISLCEKNGLEPMLTVNHFVLPQWVNEKGGWENPLIVDWLLDFTKVLVKEFKHIRYWIIINEPSNVILVGNFVGIFPPNKRSIIAAIKVRKNIIRSQKKLYDLIKKELPNTKVGNAFSFMWFRALDKKSIIEKFLAKTLNYIINTNYIKATKNYMDFLGVNFYTGYYIDFKFSSLSTTMRNEASFVPYNLPFSKTVRPKTYKSDMGWPIVPDFFIDLLKHVSKDYNKPIFITENGIADRDDLYRPFYIITHLIALWKAMEEGIKVDGYIHWSTADNLEWVEGYAKRFGLISVDPFTSKRELRKGAKVLEEIIKEGININKLVETYIPKEQQEYAYYVIDQLLSSTTEYCPRITRA